ncbi:hypothetical protein Pmar_PMAR005749, partial [Perkinsus marinus ATCC 50983]
MSGSTPPNSWERWWPCRTTKWYSKSSGNGPLKSEPCVPNVKELTTAYNALSTLVSFELDTNKKFSKIILYGDNRTANAALASGKVCTSGKQSTLLQRAIDLIHYLMGRRQFEIHYVASAENPADAGT